MLLYRVESRISFPDSRDFKNAGPYNPDKVFLSTEDLMWTYENHFFARGEIHVRNISYDTHPDWRRDKKLYAKLDEMGFESEDLKLYHFCFSSLNQLCQWFNKEELRRLEANGYYVAVYTDPTHSYIDGDRQSLMILEKSQLQMFLMPSEVC